MTSPAPFRRGVRRARLLLAEEFIETHGLPEHEDRLDERIRDELVDLLVVLLFARRADALAGDAVDLERLRRIAEVPDRDPGELRDAGDAIRRATGTEASTPEGSNWTPAPEALGAAARELDDGLRDGPDFDHLGELHQEFHRRTLEFGEGSAALSDRGSRRTSGLYYTPAAVVRDIVERTLAALDDGSTLDLRSARILDPAAGSGAFLCAALRKLVRRHRRAETFDDERALIRHVLHHSLFGADLDARALELARWNLRLAALDAADRPLPLEILRVGDSLAAGNSLVFATREEVRDHPDPEATFDEVLRRAHDLDPNDYSPVHWDHRFAEILTDPPPDAAGFDAVVGNPPWVSFGLRDAGSMPPALKDYFRARFPDSAEYKLPTYPLFVALGLRLANRDGSVSFLLPDSFLTGPRFSQLRSTLLERADLEELTLLSDEIWSGTTAGRCVILRAAANRSESAPSTEHEEGVRVRRVEAAGELGSGSAGELRPLCAITNGSDRRFELLFDDASRNLVREMRAGSVPLGDRLEFYSGCIARYGQDSVRSSSPRDAWEIRDSDGAPVLLDRAARSRWRVLVPSGRHVRPYEIYRSGTVLYFHPDPELRRRYAKSGFDAARYERPKLLLRQTGHELVAARDDRGAFCFNNLHVANAAWPGVDLYTVAALLNSAPLRTFYRTVSMEAGRSLAQTVLERLRTLPMPAGLGTRTGDIARLSRERHKIGARLAEADRQFADRVTARREPGWQTLSLGALLEYRDELSLEPLASSGVRGRTTDLSATAREGAILLRARVDGVSRELARLECSDESTGAALLLGLRETLRRQWRRRLWGRGNALDALTENLEVRWPDDLGGISTRHLLAGAARAPRIDETLDREVCRLYDVSPELVDTVDP